MSYSEKLIDHYENPRNIGSLDKHAEDVGTGLVGAPACGDVMKLQIKVSADGLIEDAKEVLLKLFDADAEYSADTLEDIYDELELAGKKVLKGDVSDELAGEVLGLIARQEDLNGRIRRNVMDTRRAVSFMMRSRMLNAEQFEEARQILRESVERNFCCHRALETEPAFDFLRGDPEFRRLVDDARARHARALQVFRSAGGESLLFAGRMAEGDQ